MFLPAILVPAYASSNPEFPMMYSAYKLNKQGDNRQPCVVLLSHLEPIICSIQGSDCCLLTEIQVSQETGKKWKWKSLNSVQLFLTPWTIHSMEFSRPKYCSGSLSLLWGIFPPRDQTQVSCIAGRFFTSWATREAQEYWSGLPILCPADLPDPGIELESPALQVDSLPTELLGNPRRQGILPPL